MKSSVALMLSLSLLLLACVSQPSSIMAVRVQATELDKYWVPREESMKFNLDAIPEDVRLAGGYAAIEYLIDQKGRVAKLRIVESSPVELWGQVAAQVIAANSYLPASTNPEYTPAIVTRVVKFKPVEE